MRGRALHPSRPELTLALITGQTFMHPACGQRKGRSLEWVRSCRVRSARSTKPLPQPSIWHTHGFSPVWIRQCRSRPHRELNDLPQFAHGHSCTLLRAGAGSPSATVIETVELEEAGALPAVEAVFRLRGAAGCREDCNTAGGRERFSGGCVIPLSSNESRNAQTSAIDT